MNSSRFKDVISYNKS